MDFWIQMLYAPSWNTETPRLNDVVHILTTDSMGTSIQRHDKYRVVDNRVKNPPLLTLEDVFTGEITKENVRAINKLHGHKGHWIRVV